MIAKVNCTYSIAGFPTGKTEKMTLSGVVELTINDVEAPLDDFELFGEAAGWADELFQHTLEEDGYNSGFRKVNLSLDIQSVDYV